jgi:hypothetical protein
VRVRVTYPRWIVEEVLSVRHIQGLAAALAISAIVLAAPSGTAVATTPATGAGIAVGLSFDKSLTTTQTVALFPTAKVARIFEHNLVPWGSSPLRAVPATMQIWVSFTTLPSLVDSGAYNATFAAILQSWNASGRTIYWDWQHEADDPSRHFTPSEITKGWAQLLSVEHKYPSSRVKSMSIYEAFLLEPNHPHGNPDAWYVPADVLGFDTYLSANEARVMVYAKSKGKPWSMPETGHDAGDIADLAWMKSMVATYQSYPPIGFAWYSTSNPAAPDFSDPLEELPRTLAYLRTL